MIIVEQDLRKAMNRGYFNNADELLRAIRRAQMERMIEEEMVVQRDLISKAEAHRVEGRRWYWLDTQEQITESFKRMDVLSKEYEASK